MNVIPDQLRGKTTFRSETITMSPMAIPMTVLGPILTPFSFSVSKYLIRPAEDWNPLSFFFAMNRRIRGPYITPLAECSPVLVSKHR